MANQFWSDPRFMSSYVEAAFRPRSAQPGEVTLLIPNIMNPTETIPVHIPMQQLMNVYMSIFSDQLPFEESDYQDTNYWTARPRNLPNTW